MRSWAVVLLVLGGQVATPTEGHAQGWELSFGRMSIGVADEARAGQVPVGGTLVGRTFPSGSGVFVELAWSGAWKTRQSSVCHGLVEPGSCVEEPVTHSGGVAFASVGWRQGLGGLDRFSFGLLPSAGLGLLRARERGTFTGRAYGETLPSVRLGVGLELSWRPTSNGWELVGEVSRHESWMYRPACDDCGNLLGTRTSQQAIILGVRWGIDR